MPLWFLVKRGVRTWPLFYMSLNIRLYRENGVFARGFSEKMKIYATLQHAAICAEICAAGWLA